MAAKSSEIPKIYKRYNDGLFADVDPQELGTSKPTLRGTELTVAREINQCLQRHGTAVVVDFGAMFAASLVRIGTCFREKIEAKTVQLVATNKEPKFSIERALPAAQREVNSLGQPLIESAQAIHFLQENHKLVTYIPGVTAGSLASKLAQRGIPAVNIVHEHFGGLFHANDRVSAVQGVASVLAPDAKLITVASLIDDPSYGFPCETRGIKPKDPHYAWPAKPYQIYIKK